jgi:putative Mg2+ transporter-C (MgtC) family protein
MLHSTLELALVSRLLIAALLGGVMGLERSIAGKHAGLRTYALVALGACLFVLCGTLASVELAAFPGINPLIIASAIVTGIGFIGAGLAAFRGEHPGELTTAAGLWVAAGVGMAAGFGLFYLATATAVLSVIVLSLLTKLEHMLRVRFGKDGE